MTEVTLFNGRDRLDRLWLVTARPGAGSCAGQLIVNFTCWLSSGRGKALNQTSAWGPDGWDLARAWLPRSPRPVPQDVLDVVERELRLFAEVA